MRGNKVLVVDDSDEARKLIIDAFTAIGPQYAQVVGHAGDGVEALAWLAHEVADIVSLDLQMPRMDGLSCLRHIRERHPCVRVVVVSDYANSSDSLLALRLGACAVLPKAGADAAQLSRALELLLGV